MSKLIFLISALTTTISADNLHIDDFAIYLNKGIDDIKEQRVKSFESLEKEDDLYEFYYLLGAEEEGKIVLQEYLEFCINTHIKIRND